MKKLLLFVMMLLSTTANAYDEGHDIIIDGIYYTYGNWYQGQYPQTAKVVASKDCSYSGLVILHNQVYDVIYERYLDVTSISLRAFQDCSGLTGVVIPKSITGIGNSAFNNCKNLKDVYLYCEDVLNEYSLLFYDTPVDVGGTLHVSQSLKAKIEALDKLPWNKFQNIVVLKPGDPGYAENIGGSVDDDVTLTARSYTRQYGEANPTFGYTVTSGTITSGQPTITCSATKTSPVGTYDIVISKGTVSNGTVNLVNGTLTITKAPLTISAGNYTKTEGEANPTFTPSFSGFKNGENNSVLTKQPTVSCSATTSSPAGTYTVTVSGASAQNYNISYVNGTLTVKAKESGGDNPNPSYKSLNNYIAESTTTQSGNEVLISPVIKNIKKIYVDLTKGTTNDSYCFLSIDNEGETKGVGLASRDLQSTTANTISINNKFYSIKNAANQQTFSWIYYNPDNSNEVILDLEQYFGSLAKIKKWQYNFGTSCVVNIVVDDGQTTGPIAVKNSDGVTIYYNYINNGNELEVTYKDEYYNSYSGTVNIPNQVTYGGKTMKVTRIGSNAFRDCFALTSVTIPVSVTSIGDYAFQYCRGLMSVTVGWSTPITITSSVFQDSNYQQATLFVPNGKKAGYKAANVWKNFNMIEDGTLKCATPTLQIVDGKINLSCETEGVTYHWLYGFEGCNAEDIGDVIILSGTTICYVSVRATKEGYEDSDIATAEVELTIGKSGDTNQDGVVSIADAVNVVNIILNKGGASAPAIETPAVGEP